MLQLNTFVPTERGIEELWKKFDAIRDHMPGLVDNPFGFVTWLCAQDAITLLVGPTETPVGAFIFTGITPGDSAWCHPIIWDQRAIAKQHEDLVEAAQAACTSIMRQFNLHRLNGATPETNVVALRFAERVGFKHEGTHREALRCGKGWQHTFTTGMLEKDLQDAIDKHQHDKLGEKE